ncbi:unnamed protein product [Enterobius vermicularis]|uniref:RRM domain-containing protein n=1 Tax=Enterobius vermicularis TaxID=51028 RepID=A0A0N4V8C5_ENTVE|nr:unnamed protein product [Enterobius vermicularis]
MPFFNTLYDLDICAIRLWETSGNGWWRWNVRVCLKSSFVGAEKVGILMTGARVYIGRLSYRAEERDIERFFRGYGKISEILIKNGYAFVEFCDYRDAEDAVHELHGRTICGDRVIVELAKSKPRGWDAARYHGRSRSPYRRSRSRSGRGHSSRRRSRSRKRSSSSSSSDSTSPRRRSVSPKRSPKKERFEKRKRGRSSSSSSSSPESRKETKRSGSSRRRKDSEKREKKKEKRYSDSESNSQDEDEIYKIVVTGFSKQDKVEKVESCGFGKVSLGVLQ